MTVSTDSVLAYRADESLVDRVKRHEGFRSTMYRCSAGRWTVGYGFNLEALSMPVEVAELWLSMLLDRCSAQLDTLQLHSLASEPNRRNVLVEMIYQLGFARFLRFSKLLQAVRQGSWAFAALEMMDSKWARQCPSRARELSHVMRTGSWS